MKTYPISAIHILSMWQCVGLLNVTFCQIELTLREEMFGSRYSYLSTYLAIRFCIVSLESLSFPLTLIPRLSSSPGSSGLKLHLKCPPD